MDTKTQQAVEGLQRIAAAFSQAGAIATALESFASAEQAAATWMGRVKTSQEELDVITRKMAEIRERHDIAVAEINADALKQREQLKVDVATLNKQLTDLASQTAAANQRLADINVKVSKAETHRAKLLASLN